ncbi:MAG: cytochrome-c peroxidase [Gammaproteobacteria bacterium]
MRMRQFCGRVAATIIAISFSLTASAQDPSQLRAGHPDLQQWLLPDQPPTPKNNAITAARVELGKQLFFDPRLSGDGSIACATCHNPALGWSDGRQTGIGFGGTVLHRASPTVINTAYNRLQMWDGRERSLESQAIGPMRAAAEMNTNFDVTVPWLAQNPGYAKAFGQAYPGEPVGTDTIGRAIASFERTVISNDSPFDQWVRGDEDAMSASAVRGFGVFLDADKGNCVVCHAAPNFTDDGFHNLGLRSYLNDNPDLGRFEHVPVAVLKGAFKTPTLRDIATTAPYFHDGSAATLDDVIDHYEQGGEATKDLSPNMKPLQLSTSDKQDLVAFMEALTTPAKPFTAPTLPPDTGPPRRVPGGGTTAQTR